MVRRIRLRLVVASLAAASITAGAVGAAAPAGADDLCAGAWVLVESVEVCAPIP